MLGFEGLYEKNWKTVKKKIKIFHFFYGVANEPSLMEGRNGKPDLLIVEPETLPLPGS